MSKSPGTISYWAETIKNLAEVVAILVGGGWAFWHFSYAERPSLEARGQVSSTLDWFAASDADDCIGRFGVTIKNIGVTSFDIEKLTLQVWLVDPRAAKTGTLYLNPADFQNGPASFKKDVQSESLTGRYDAGTEHQDDYVFIFPRQPAKLALFRLDAHRVGTRGGQRERDITEFRWEDKCAGLKSQ